MLSDAAGRQIYRSRQQARVAVRGGRNQSEARRRVGAAPAHFGDTIPLDPSRRVCPTGPYPFRHRPHSERRLFINPLKSPTHKSHPPKPPQRAEQND